MEQQIEEQPLLKDYSDSEKGAYIGVIASLATADRVATDEEMDFLEALSKAAELSPEQESAVFNAAKDPSQVSLQESIEALKGSDLSYSLMTDIISFAKSDGKYSLEEERKIRNLAVNLNITDEQFDSLNEFVDKAGEAQKNGEDITKPSFLNSGGMGNIFDKLGISSGTLISGLLGIVAPMVLGRMFRNRNNGMGQNSGGLGGMFGGNNGGGLGGMFGGNNSNTGGGGLLGGLLGGGGINQGGGLGSILSSLSGGRGYGGLGSILGGLFR